MKIANEDGSANSGCAWVATLIGFIIFLIALSLLAPAGPLFFAAMGQ